jgi:hypothetical protein
LRPPLLHSKSVGPAAAKDLWFKWDWSDDHSLQEDEFTSCVALRPHPRAFGGC